MRRVVLLVAMACSSKSSAPPPPPPPPVAVTIDAAPPPPQFMVRDPEAAKLLAAAAVIDVKEIRFATTSEHLPAMNAFAVYTNGTTDGRDNKAIAETCASFLHDPKPSVRALAAGCVGRAAHRGLQRGETNVREPVIMVLLDAIEHETDEEVWRTDAEALRRVSEAKDMSPTPGLSAAQSARIIAVIAKTPDPERASTLYQALFTPASTSDNSTLLPAVEELTLAQLAKDTTDRMTYIAYDAANRISETRVCPVIAKLLRPDAKNAFKAMDWVAVRRCDGLLDQALDVAIARASNEPDDLVVFETFETYRILPPATRARIAKGLRAVKSKDRSRLDRYAAMFEHERSVPCADGIPC